MKDIKTASEINTTIVIPGSKSITHRALIAAALADGESILRNYLECEDTAITADVLEKLGIFIEKKEGDLIVRGTGAKFVRTSKKTELFLGNSGTSYRLLLSIVALFRGEFLMTGVPRMLERPVGELVIALNSLGVDARCINNNSCPPVIINAEGIKGGKVSIAGNLSSQYISSLLLAAPYADKDIKIEVTGELVSGPYVDITVDVMEAFGVKPERTGYRSFKIPSGREYHSCDFKVQGDASSASYFWAAAAITGGRIVTENIFPFTTRQGDIHFLDVLEKMGSRVIREKDRVTVIGEKLTGIDIDMSTMPDMVPTLAAVALFSEGETIIRNVHHLRIKESDRLSAVAQEWTRMGGKVEEMSDGLIIHGQRTLEGTVVDPHDDHRLAMSLAVVGLKIPGIRIKNPECVAKSFPMFWELWDTVYE